MPRLTIKNGMYVVKYDTTEDIIKKNAEANIISKIDADVSAVARPYTDGRRMKDVTRAITGGDAKAFDVFRFDTDYRRLIVFARNILGTSIVHPFPEKDGKVWLIQSDGVDFHIAKISIRGLKKAFINYHLDNDGCVESTYSNLQSDYGVPNNSMTAAYDVLCTIEFIKAIPEIFKLAPVKSKSEYAEVMSIYAARTSMIAEQRKFSAKKDEDKVES